MRMTAEDGRHVSGITPTVGLLSSLGRDFTISVRQTLIGEGCIL